MTCFVFLFAFSASPPPPPLFLCCCCFWCAVRAEVRLNYLTRMRRGSNNRETPKGVPSSKNNRQLATCRPFRDSCMRTKPNSYAKVVTFWAAFTHRVAKPFSMHTDPAVRSELRSCVKVLGFPVPNKMCVCVCVCVCVVLCVCISACVRACVCVCHTFSVQQSECTL